MKRPTLIPGAAPPAAVPVAAPPRAKPRRKAPRAAARDEPAPIAPIPDEAAVRSRDVWRAAHARRRALRAEIRRFTKSTRRRRLIWTGSLAAVLALVLGSFVVANSPLFSVQRITVVGASVLDARVVEAVLASQMGTPLARIDQSEIEEALAQLPWIESYWLQARPPHELLVQIVERTPVGVIESAAGYRLVDAAGVTLQTTPEQPPGQPVLVVSGGMGSAAFAAAGMVVRSVPEPPRSDLVRVTASTPYDVTLTLASGIEIVWGGVEDSVLKGRVLEEMMQARPDARRIDVSSPEAVVVS